MESTNPYAGYRYPAEIIAPPEGAALGEREKLIAQAPRVEMLSVEKELSRPRPEDEPTQATSGCAKWVVSSKAT